MSMKATPLSGHPLIMCIILQKIRFCKDAESGEIIEKIRQVIQERKHERGKKACKIVIYHVLY